MKTNCSTIPLLELDNKRLISSEAMGEDLLPGIPNEITLDMITPKVPWKAFHNLSYVSRGWRQAIQRHQIHDARVRSHSTETLAVLRNKSTNCEVDWIALYSSRDQRFYDVPPISHLGGIPRSCQCISLNGQLYVLGGLKTYITRLSSAEVYVLDLAGQRQWRQCASMQFPRQEFGCGVVDGKIYVFGGISLWKPVPVPEVYDFKENAWSPLSSMYSRDLRFNQRVATVGKELVVYGGEVFDSGYEDWIVDRVIDRHGNVSQLDGEEIGRVRLWHKFADTLEIYNPDTKQWRNLVKAKALSDLVLDMDSVEDGTEVLNMVSGEEGKFYSLTWKDVYVHDIYDRDSRTRLHSIYSILPRLPRHSFMLEQFITPIVDGELLATVCCFSFEGNVLKGKSCLVRSRGFGRENVKIVWQKAPVSREHRPLDETHIICTIEL